MGQLRSGCGEVRSVPGIGGGRGVFALRDIRAGEVVSQEMPFLSLSEQELEAGNQGLPVFERLAARILQGDDSESLLGTMKILYPSTLEDVPPEVLAKAWELHGDRVTRLMSASRSPALSREETLRVLLQVVFNAFQSGMYTEKPMFNHCDLPNCASFGKGERPMPGGDSKVCNMSEVVATRLIKEGKEITICYISPSQQSYTARCKLWEAQHIVPLGPSPWPAEMEAFAGEGIDGFDRSAALQKLEAIEDGMRSVGELLESGQMEHNYALAALQGVPITELVSPKHLAAWRWKDLMVQCLHAVVTQHEQPDPLLVIQILRLSLQLLEAMKHNDVLGPDHCDIARAQCDVHQSLDYLLNNGHMKLLADAFPGALDAPGKISRAEFAARKEYLRISKLYT